MEIKFEDIQKANEQIKTTDIKGKEYAEVNQRIKAFRMIVPNGIIKTEMISNENGICIFKAEVGYMQAIYNDITKELNAEFFILGTGHAYEKENSTFINKTSYIENCETSAVGRALGMAGFGIDTSVASAEEVENAILQQENDAKISKNELTVLQALIKSMPDPKEFYDFILETYKVTDLAELTKQQDGEILIMIKKAKGE